MQAALNEKTEQWMGMDRSTEEHRRAADEYYNMELMPLIVELFTQRKISTNNDKPEYMILSVGTSYEPLVLSISFFQPQKILFLYTDDTEQEIDKIVDFIHLKSSSYYKQRIDKSNSLIIYQAIKDAYINWGKPKNIYIDFTGGTKAMSAATAMAGAVLDAQLIYVSNSDYLGQLRKPRPGTEFIEKIPNPYEVFGDLDDDRAFGMFSSHDYSGARQIFQGLYERVPEPRQRQYYKILYLLTACYEHWDSLELNNAENYMTTLVEELEKDIILNREFILMDRLEILRRQKAILEILSKNVKQMESKTPFEILLNLEDILPMMFTVYKNAIRRKEQCKYDMASLLLYRLLEMIMQRRLALYGIYVAHAEYEKVFPTKEKYKEFEAEVLKYRRCLFGHKINTYLPENISLVEGYIQLAALKDEIIEEDAKSEKYLKNILNHVNARNHNIFAHGFKSLSEKEYLNFENFVTGIFKTFCSIEEVNTEQYDKEISFINPLNTMYIR